MPPPGALDPSLGVTPRCGGQTCTPWRRGSALLLPEPGARGPAEAEPQAGPSCRGRPLASARLICCRPWTGSPEPPTHLALTVWASLRRSCRGRGVWSCSSHRVAEVTRFALTFEPQGHRFLRKGPHSSHPPCEHGRTLREWLRGRRSSSHSGTVIGPLAVMLVFPNLTRSQGRDRRNHLLLLFAWLSHRDTTDTRHALRFRHTARRPAAGRCHTQPRSALVSVPRGNVHGRRAPRLLLSAGRSPTDAHAEAAPAHARPDKCWLYLRRLWE